ncbi:MAG: TIGR04282 family arsenosugar biosynthesis glycosyltransferase [Pseudomonadota bacterium]
MKRTLIVMLKVPRAGRVKTRLGREIGIVPAAWWFRHQTAHLIARLEDLRWQTVLAVAPDVEGVQSRMWPAHMTRWPQGRGTLGRRMTRMMAMSPPGPACVIGGDIPGITAAHVWQGFRALGDHDAVFGPAPDGGYWLIGLKHPRRQSAGFLDGVRWSTPHALADSRACLAGQRIAQIAVLRDVDTAHDLAMTRLRAHVTPKG